jgi:hypothetical protein
MIFLLLQLEIKGSFDLQKCKYRTKQYMTVQDRTSQDNI